MRQPRQHLAHARPADAEDLGQPLLHQLGARVQAVLEDGDVDLLVDLVVGVLALQSGLQGGLARAGGRHVRVQLGQGVTREAHAVLAGALGRLGADCRDEARRSIGAQSARSVGTHRQANSRPQPRTCAGSTPAARSWPQTVVLTVSSNGMSSSASTRSASAAARRLVQKVVMACGRARRDLAHQRAQALGLDQREVVVDADAQVALGNDLDADRAVVVDDALLHVGGVGRDQRQPRHAAQREQLVEREHRGGGRDAGALGDALDQAPVGIEAEPARRGAAPADDVDRASASSSAAARILLSSNWPSACADSEISVTLKREKCALQPGTAAASALVSGSSAVLDEGVSTPRRTGRGHGIPV